MRTKARTAKFSTTAIMAAASLSFIASATAPANTAFLMQSLQSALSVMGRG